MYAYKEQKSKITTKEVFYFTFLIGDVGVPWPPATEGAVTATDDACVLVVFALLVTPAKVLVLSEKYLQDSHFHFSLITPPLLQHRAEFLFEQVCQLS